MICVRATGTAAPTRAPRNRQGAAVKRVGQVGHVDLGQEAQLAQVDPEHRGPLPVGQPHGPQHRPVPAQADHQVRATAQFLGRDRDRATVQPHDLVVDAEDLGVALRGPVQDRVHGTLGVPLRMQDQSDGVHLSAVQRISAS